MKPDLKSMNTSNPTQQALELRLATFLTDLHAAGKLLGAASKEPSVTVQELEECDIISQQTSQASHAFTVETRDGMMEHRQGPDSNITAQQLYHHDDSLLLLYTSAESSRVPSIYATSTTASSKIRSTDYDEKDAASLHSVHSRRGLIRNLSFPASTLKLPSSLISAYTPESTKPPPRVTVAHLPSRQKPKKTVSRKVYQVFCWGLDFIIPIELDDEKTSMRQSSLVKLLTLQENPGFGQGRGVPLYLEYLLLGFAFAHFCQFSRNGVSLFDRVRRHTCTRLEDS